MSTKLYVGNLPFSTTSQDLQSLFSQHGSVSSAELVSDKFTGRSRGFAFVEMATAEDAQKAIQALNGYQLDGRALTVNEAKPREDRPRGNFGGGGGGGGFRSGGGGGGGYRGGGGGGGNRGGGGFRGDRDRGGRGERGDRGESGAREW